MCSPSTSVEQLDSSSLPAPFRNHPRSPMACRGTFEFLIRASVACFSLCSQSFLCLLHPKKLCSSQTCLLIILPISVPAALSLRNLIRSHSFNSFTPPESLFLELSCSWNFKLAVGVSFLFQLKFNTAKACLYFPSPTPPPHPSTISVNPTVRV